jgi:hypothetical protein
MPNAAHHARKVTALPLQTGVAIGLQPCIRSMQSLSSDSVRLRRERML